MTQGIVPRRSGAPRAQTVKLRGDGVWLEADVYGPSDGPPVFFFHGGGQSRRSWRGAAQRTAAVGNRAYTIDLRGHGGSDWDPEGDYLLDAFARDVEQLILGQTQPVVLVGASRGGQAALVAGARWPGRIRLMMLADVTPALLDEGVDDIRQFLWASTSGFADADEAADALAQHLKRRREKDPDRLRKMMREGTDGRLYWKWDPATVKPEFLHPPSERKALEAAAAGVIDPVVLVRAEHSTIVTAESVRQFQRLTPHLEVLVAKGADHMFTGDRNDIFAAMLSKLLAGPLKRRTDVS